MIVTGHHIFKRGLKRFSGFSYRSKISFHYCIQLFFFVRFQNEVEGRMAYRIYHILLEGTIKYYFHPWSCLATDVFQNFDARAVRKVYVKEDQVWLHLQDRSLSLGCGRGCEYDIYSAIVSEIILQTFNAVRQVFYYYCLYGHFSGIVMITVVPLLPSVLSIE